VTPGLILLFFIAAIGAFFFTKARRRLGLPAGSKLPVAVIVAFAIVILVIYVAQSNH